MARRQCHNADWRLGLPRSEVQVPPIPRSSATRGVGTRRLVGHLPGFLPAFNGPSGACCPMAISAAPLPRTTTVNRVSWAPHSRLRPACCDTAKPLISPRRTLVAPNLAMLPLAVTAPWAGSVKCPEPAMAATWFSRSQGQPRPGSRKGAGISGR
jgi:hypothetical protein